MHLYHLLLGRPRGHLIFILSLFLVTSRHAITASPVYDPNKPHEVENFDPAEADPLRNITCLGDSYDLELPMLGSFNPNGVSMQKLCAKPQYGGGAPGQHAGGWCVDPPGPQSRFHGVTTGTVAFDPGLGAQTNAQLQNSRFLLGCFYRCFCNHGLADTSVQPRTEQTSGPKLFDTLKRRSQKTYELEIDVVNDFTTPAEQKLGKRGTTRVDATSLWLFRQVDNSRGRGDRVNRRDDISLDEENYIECSGNLPSWNPPPPFLIHPPPNSNTTPDFASNQELCAMQLSGGNK